MSLKQLMSDEINLNLYLLKIEERLNKNQQMLFFFHVSDFDRQENYDFVESAQNY